MIDSTREAEVRQVYYGRIREAGDEDVGGLYVSVDDLCLMKAP
jgi:hypothetical protein